MTVLTLHRGSREDQPRSKAIAGRLRALLAEEQVPAIRIAESLGLTQSKFARRMSGSVPLSVDEIDAICEILGIRFEWLVTGDGPRFDPDDGCPHQGSNLGPAD
ncbi:XRE family transcriptional regulator [Gordonia sp. OPL2]|nr:XRE family transcriptional regulator [Gordonia sp. OPL2]